MKNWSRKIKIAFFSTIIVLQFFAFLSPMQAKAQLIPDPIKTDTKAKTPEELPVYNGGVDKSIQDYLCTPNGKGTDLFDCVDRLYRFGVTAGAISIVFFIVYAGYIYITGGEASKTKAKQTIYSALTGMAILLGSYVLLSFINPNLVQIKTIQPPIFSAIELPGCEAIGFAEKCIIEAGSSGGGSGQVYNPPGKTGKAGCYAVEQGGCTKSTLSACPGMLAQGDLALKICNNESAGGNYAVSSGSDMCRETTTGQGVSFSIGLWQINMETSAGDFPECKGVLSHVSPGGACVVRDPGNPDQCKCKFGPQGRSGYDACVKALQNPQNNTKAACKLFNGRPANKKWYDWKNSFDKCSKA